MGGFTSAKKEIIDVLRQTSRPYLFSNSLAPSMVGAAIQVLDLLSSSTELRDKLARNAKQFRQGMELAGFDLRPGEHAIVPVMLYDAELAQRFADQLLEEGVYVVGFFYPVVPRGLARIRVQLSAAHEAHQIQKAIAAFVKVGLALGVIPKSLDSKGIE
jgi:glycine C-acetyltransferase